MSDEIENSALRNRQLIDGFVNAGEGYIKSASDAGSSMIRRKIREEGFLRRIIPIQMKTDQDLTPAIDHDRPVIIEEMEMDSPPAKSVPFGDQVDTEFYFGNKYACVFNPIATPDYTKDVNELRTYKGMDVRAVITDHALKYMHQEEDTSLITTVDRIVGPVNGAGASGWQQNFEIAGGITRDTYPEVLSILEDNRLNNGVFLMNRRTAKAFLKWDRRELGGDLAEKLARKGLKGLEDSEIMGVRHIFTMKRDLVPDGVVYLFAEPEFMGRFYSLRDITMYVEKKKDMLRFSASEIISLTIPNVAAVAKVTFI